MIHSSLHFLINLIIIFMDIFILICFISILTYDYSKFQIIEYCFKKNWSNNLIKKISIEYQENFNKEQIWESLINISFPGIIEGCDCTLYNGIIYDEKCVTSLLIEKCENIFPIKKQYFTNLYLENLDYFSNIGIQIKIERYQDFTYFDLLNNSKNNNDYFVEINCNCPKHSELCIDCGIIDSIGNHLCITSYESLKYNCYKLKLEYDLSLKDNQIIKDFEIIFNNKNYSNYLYPIEFNNIFGNKTCILEDETILYPTINYNLFYTNNDTSFFTNGPKNQGCNTKLLFEVKYDNRWHNIYSFPLDIVLDKEFKNELKSLPQFPYEEYIKHNFSISYRGFIGFSKHCVNDISFIINEIPMYQKNIKIYFIIFLFLDLVVFPYYLLLIMVIAQTELLTLYQSFFLSSSYTALIAVFLQFLFNQYIEGKNKYKILDGIANKYCGDNLTNNLFFSILKDLKNIINTIQYSIYWTIIMVILSFIKILLIITKSYKKRIMYYINNGNQIPIGNHNYNIITEVETQLLN